MDSHNDAFAIHPSCHALEGFVDQRRGGELGDPSRINDGVDRGECRFVEPGAETRILGENRVSEAQQANNNAEFAPIHF